MQANEAAMPGYMMAMAAQQMAQSECNSGLFPKYKNAEIGP